MSYLNLNHINNYILIKQYQFMCLITTKQINSIIGKREKKSNPFEI